MQNIKKYLIITVIHLLVFIVAGTIIYAQTIKYASQKDKELLNYKIEQLEKQVKDSPSLK